MTTNAAVGPLTWKAEPPNNGTTTPATIAVYKPFCGGKPTAIDNAIDNGKATNETTKAAKKSFLKSYNFV